MATDVSMIYGAFLCGPFCLGCSLGLWVWLYMGTRFCMGTLFFLVESTPW